MFMYGKCCLTFMFGLVLQKKEKRRWIFKRGLNNEQFLCDNDQQMHAMAVAAATTAAAEAAVATAQAAVEIARLTRPSNYVREHCAAIVIQTAFRGYLVSENNHFFKLLWYNLYKSDYRLESSESNWDAS